jgi:hypothetical protein
MEKPDFTDLYKFYVSLGIILIAFSGIIIWFYFFSNDIFLITVNTLENITDLGKATIITKQKLLLYVYKFIPLLSFVLFFGGILLSILGLTKWKRRQVIIDQIQDSELKKLEKEFKDLTEEEKDNKIKNEITDNEGIEPGSLIDDEASKIRKYKDIENTIFNAIVKYYGNYYEIRKNFKVGNNEFDMIMFPAKLVNTLTIFEIKYYSRDIKYAFLMNGLIKYLLAIKLLSEYISEREKRNYIYKPIIIWVYKKNNQIDKLKRYRELALKEGNIDNSKIEIIIIHEDEVCSIDKYFDLKLTTGST